MFKIHFYQNNMKLVQFSYLLPIICVYFVNAANFLKNQPDFITACKKKDPEFKKCSTATVQKLFAQLSIGIPGLKTVGPLDPFEIQRLKFNQEAVGITYINADITKAKVHGLGNTVVKESQVNDNYNWITKLLVPKMRIEGHYKIDGRILVVPLAGNGEMVWDIENMDINMFTKTKLFERGEFTFFNITNIKVDLKIGNLKVRFENLFNGNKELEKSTNQFFNENWLDVFEAVKPIITQTVESVLYNYLFNVFNYIPANFLISDIPKSYELYGKL